MTTVSSDASSQILTCLTSLASSDLNFLQCVLGSGAFKTQSGQVITQLTATEIASIVAGTGDYSFVCPTTTTSPSSACCSATSKAQQCQLSSSSLQNAVLVDCKNMMDQVVWQSYECSTPTSIIIAATLAAVVLISLITLRYLAHRPKSHLWQRQLWALIIKNVRVWRRTIDRHLRGIVFALIMIGALVIITEMTGDSVTTVTASEALNLKLEFHGPSALRAEPISQVIIAVVLEKEQRIREAIRVTGVTDGVALVSWAVSYLLAFLPLCMGLAYLTHYGNIFPNFPVTSLLLLFTSFLASSVALCLALSAFFDLTRPAVIGTLVIIYLTHFLAFLTTSSKQSQGFVCLLAPACLAVAISSGLADSASGTGFQRSYQNYLFPSTYLSPATATVIMFADALIYYILAWYLDQVVPQRIGARLPWHFPFHKSYWLGSHVEEEHVETAELSSLHENKYQRTISMKGAIHNSQNQPNQNGARIEEVDAELEDLGRQHKCIETLSLTRHYKVPGMANERIAVNRMNMTLYAGHITSILGHNGAGKTTLISMLCGLVRPTSGDALIFGLSLKRSLTQIRRSMGMCPQHDILFLDLSAAENIRLFAWLKGVEPNQVEIQARQLLTELGLGEKYHSKAGDLSGGQKRKLCVAIALIGGSRVVFLDEPTAGMDPYSRRQTWDVLLNNRKGRVMVLTTHFMDEADILSDRIAIVSDGNLCCIGTSLFLKTLYGNGYRLTVSMIGTGRDTQKSIVTSSGVQDLVLAKVNGSAIISSTNQGQDMIFELPLTEAHQFPDLFRILDSIADRVEFGISVTTLEDVFLTVASQRLDAVDMINHRAQSVNLDDPRAAKHRRRRSSVTDKIARPQQSVRSQHRRQRYSCFGRVLYQMVLKRWWLARRDYRQPLFLIVLPLMFLLVPIMIPDIQITPILRPGPGSYPSAGPSQCSVDDATDTATSCSTTASNCVAMDEYGNNVQVRPQFINAADLANKCTLFTYMGFCHYVPFICSTDVCCNWRDYRSPWYPCQTSTMIPSKITSGDADANWNVHCPRREYALVQGIVNGFVKGMAVLMAFVFAPSIVIAHAVLETEKNTKFLQLVSGVRLATYWLGAAIWDQTSVSLGVLIAMILMAFYSYPLGSVAYFPAILLIILFALSVVPLSYWASFRFSTSSRALTAMLVFNIVTGAGFGIINYILQTVTFKLPYTTITTTTLSGYLRYGLMIFPGFALTDGLLRLQNGLYITCLGDPHDPCLIQIPPTTSDIWKNCLYLVGTTIICWLGLIRREGRALLQDDDVSPLRKRFIEYICVDAERINELKQAQTFPVDEDVNVEKRYVQEMVLSRGLDPLVIAGMHKVYRTGTVALHPIYLSISSGQCLGFLGVNGAGKTTTIKCLTGAIRLTGGTAFIDGHDITKDLYAARSRAGYCPQYDALFDLLTVKQHLMMYCRIRRLRVSTVAEVIDSMQLSLFADVPAGFLSGGNRRKLSAAIALLGSPRVVYLDEPSTGMDPHAKRFLWRQIGNVISAGKTAVMLTTHSMEECEALCGKVAILMGGRLVGLGSIQHLKKRFGKGYTIEVRTTTVSSAMIQAGRRRLEGINVITQDNVHEVCQLLGDASKAKNRLIEGEIPVRQFLKGWIEQGLSDTVIAYLEQRLPAAQLKSRHGPHLVFEIRTGSLADLFAIMSTAEGIDHYAISQTSLEEIFNSLAESFQKSRES